jgi:hypothetical protein
MNSAAGGKFQHHVGTNMTKKSTANTRSEISTAQMSATKSDAKNVLSVSISAGDDQNVAMAKARLHPVVSAGSTIRVFERTLADHPFDALVTELSRHVVDVSEGKMSRPEAMLMMQAHSLDAIFNNLAQRAGNNVGANTDLAEKYLRMALKAQSQCRTTLEALAEIKMPKSATFIKQANIAEQQQVNNGNVTNGGSAPSHEKNLTQPNELLTEAPHAALDTRGTRTAGGADPQMATVGKIDGAAKRGRKNAQ